jgi:hypothetical protein
MPAPIDLLPDGPAVGMRVLVVHSGSGGSMVAGPARAASAWLRRAPGVARLRGPVPSAGAQAR